MFDNFYNILLLTIKISVTNKVETFLLHFPYVSTKSTPEHGSWFSSFYKKKTLWKKNFLISKCWKFCRTTLTFLFQFYKSFSLNFLNFLHKVFHFLFKEKSFCNSFWFSCFFYRIQFTQSFSINFWVFEVFLEQKCFL